MSDGTKTDESTETQIQEKHFSQTEVDSIIKQRLAREQEKYSDYNEIKKTVETLQREKKEREEAEMTEIDKLKKEREELSLEIELHKKNTEWRQNWENQETISIEKEMEDLTDNQKLIINGLPLDQRRLAIQEFKASSNSGIPNASKGISKIDGIPTIEECKELRIKYGAGSEIARNAYKKYLENKR